MIRLIQRRLIVPRGDTGTFTIPVLAGKDTGDVSIFTVFDPLMHRKIFEKVMTLSGETLTMELTHGDTVNLPVGQYVWDIKFYTDPIFAEEKLIGGTEVDSYYAAFTLPVCEIRETGDNLLMSDDAPTGALKPGQIDFVTASINEMTSLKNTTTIRAAEADTSAQNAANSAQDASVSAQEALDSQAAALVSQQAAQTAAESAQASATLASQRAAEIEANLESKANIADLAAVAFSGNYNDLSNKPTIPDIQIEGYSIVENGVANIPHGSDSQLGVIRTDARYGIAGSSSGVPQLSKASSLKIKQGTDEYRPIVPENQHESVFYGLAKAASDTTQSQSNNNVGTYTANAKVAIQTMLDVPAKADIPTAVSQLTNDAGYLTTHQDISGKANSADLATVATSGSYNDLSNKPFIPSAISDLTDDSGHYTKPVGGIPASDLANGVLDVWSGLTYHRSTMSTDSDSFVLGGATDAPTEINKCLVTSTPDANVIPKFDYQGRLHSVTPEDEWDGSNAVATTEYVDNMISDNMPEIPTNVSELNNDAGYITGYTETDPTVPAWAKAAQKPSYTAAEVGAPTIQEMNSAISTAIGNVNSFDMAVVQELPTQDINTHIIYLVPKTGDTNDVYDEYIYINNAWEMVGNTQIDLSNYVQKDQYASSEIAGLIKTNPTYGLSVNSETGLMSIIPATAAHIKAGTSPFEPITVNYQHNATFYGLAKAAGDTTQSQSNNAVGTYTNEAKSAIRTMLGAAASNDIPNVPVQDVQVNGSSIINANGEANIPYATASSAGLAQAADGLMISSQGGGKLMVNKATDSQIKAGLSAYYPIVPGTQEKATFYGLAKAAGDSTQASSENAVGTYTTEAKTAIQNMFGVPSINDLPDMSLYAPKASPVFTGSISLGRKTNTTIGASSFACGINVTASGESSYGEGIQTKATGQGAHAEGTGTTASGDGSHAEGANTTASGSLSHAEGTNATASGDFSHVEGSSTIASQIGAHAEGLGSQATGLAAHAEGEGTVASGEGSHAEGLGTIANHTAQHVSGIWNVADPSSSTAQGNYVEIIGNGTTKNAKSNARALDWSGNEYLKGNIYVGCNADSTGGTRLATITELAAKLDAAEAGLKVVRLI